MIKRFSSFLTILLYITVFLILNSGIISAQVPTPPDVFGFKPGADYELADYDMMLDYYDQPKSASDRVKKIEIGKSVVVKPMLLLFISSKENPGQLDKWKAISEKLAVPKWMKRKRKN